MSHPLPRQRLDRRLCSTVEQALLKGPSAMMQDLYQQYRGISKSLEADADYCLSCPFLEPCWNEAPKECAQLECLEMQLRRWLTGDLKVN